MAKKNEFQEQVEKRLSQMPMNELLEKHLKIDEIMSHSLFTSPPQSVVDSYSFGWLRGIAIMTDTMLEGRWYNWLKVIAKGEIDWDEMPKYSVTTGYKNNLTTKMLNKCMDGIQNEGYHVTHFIDWIGYALGISWFEKPKLSERAWKYLYETFNLDLFFMEPSDYFSQFLAERGQGGVLDYFPTPMQITTMINQMVCGEDRTASQFEPCVGAAAMLLPSHSLNLVGADLSHTMTKVASIQAFLYMPWMLYVPKPIVGLHVNKETLTVNKYFEFDTNTRLYNGDSLLGEYKAPADIFAEGSEWIDVYCHPLDLTKRDIFNYDEHMCQPWESVPHELKIEIVKAQCREIGFETLTTNPPFNMRLNKHDMENIKNILKSNETFIAERKQEEESHPLFEQIVHEVELKAAEIKSKKVIEGQLELIFD